MHKLFPDIEDKYIRLRHTQSFLQQYTYTPEGKIHQPRAGRCSQRQQDVRQG